MAPLDVVFENGVFRPLKPLDLPEGSHFEIAPRLLDESGSLDEALDRIYAVLGERYQSGEPDVAARHNEHQP